MAHPAPSRPALFRRPVFVVGVNLALLAVLALLVISSSPAGARENGAAPRARGEYTLLTGRAGSGSASTVYIIDGANAELISLRYDQRTLFALNGYRSLEADAKATPQR
jgi:hypothetical protein